MLTSLLTLSDAPMLLVRVVRTPGAILGPIAALLGAIYNALFNFIYSFTQSGSLGIAIILFTIFVKVVLFPLAYKQQKSTFKMQKLQPEIAKIRQKYATKKDQESQQRMAFEMQEFQKKNGVSLFGGCLPLLVQLPILYALFYIFQQPHMYVDVIGNVYQSLGDGLVAIPAGLRMEAIGQYGTELANALKIEMDLSNVSDVIRVINSLSQAQWDQVMGTLGAAGDSLRPLLAQKLQVEQFFTINLVDNAGFALPGILIPILSGISTWISSKLIMQNQAQNPDDPTANTMKTMNMIMPVMMGVLAVSMPAALGLYWTVSNFCQMGTQVLLQKHFAAKDKREAVQ